MGVNARIVDTTHNAIVEPTTKRRRGSFRRAAKSAPENDPTAISALNIPYWPAPLWNTVVAMTAVVSCWFKAKAEAKPTTTIIRIRSGRPRKYTSPSRNCPFFRGTGRRGTKSLWRIDVVNIAAIRNIPEFTKKTQASPTQSIIRPEIAGPTRRAKLKATELSATAFVIDEAGTSSETKAWRAGESKAAATPPPKAKP